MSILYRNQPLYAFVELTIGGVDVSSFTDNIHDTIVDLSFTRKTYYTAGNVGSKFNVTLYDDTALEIEEILANSVQDESGTDNITINYGWTKNDTEKVAEASLNGLVTQYALSFEGVGTTLSIEGIISSVASAGEVKTIDYGADTYEGKPSSIVKAICEEEGWEVGYIEETETCLADDGSVKTYTRNAKSASAFINSMLEESTSTETGDTGYIFFFSEDGKAYFISEGNTKVSVNKSNNGNSTDTNYETTTTNEGFDITGKYEFYSGRQDNTVISFTPEFKGRLVSKSVASTVSAIDATKNEMLECSIDGTTYIGNLGSSGRIMGLSTASFQSLEKKACSMWNLYCEQIYTATMEIIGDPTVKIGTYIYIAVYTKYGFLHHTSGIYYIKQAEDSISGASFTTTLTLQRRGSSMSNIKTTDEAENILEKLESSNNGTSSAGETSSASGTTSSNTASGATDSGERSSNATIESACQFAVNIANDSTHGYDQNDRWGNPNYDCSGLVITAYQSAGVPVKTNGASYTGDIYSVFTKTGFKDVTSSCNLGNADGMQRGDVLLKSGSHVAIYLGGGKIVHASINENGKITGGVSGDQTGKEICTRDYYNHPWGNVLRYS